MASAFYSCASSRTKEAIVSQGFATTTLQSRSCYSAAKETLYDATYAANITSGVANIDNISLLRKKVTAACNQKNDVSTTSPAYVKSNCRQFCVAETIDRDLRPAAQYVLAPSVPCCKFTKTLSFEEEITAIRHNPNKQALRNKHVSYIEPIQPQTVAEKLQVREISRNTTPVKDIDQVEKRAKRTHEEEAKKPATKRKKNYLLRAQYNPAIATNEQTTLSRNEPLALSKSK